MRLDRRGESRGEGAHMLRFTSFPGGCILIGEYLRREDHMEIKELYPALIGYAGQQAGAAEIEYTCIGEQWCLAHAEGVSGLAMHTPVSTVAPMFPGGIAGLQLKEAARALQSWDLREASFALAAVNACLNTPERMKELGAYLPASAHYGDGLELEGRTVGIVGHMRGPKGLREQARKVYVLERSPQPGDYPDSACEELLPLCDLVIITGSSLINKTLPRLLELSRNAFKILTGPSVPLWPGLLDMGLDRISGLVVTDAAAAKAHVEASVPGNPYKLGESFLLKRR